MRVCVCVCPRDCFCEVYCTGSVRLKFKGPVQVLVSTLQHSMTSMLNLWRRVQSGCHSEVERARVEEKTGTGSPTVQLSHTAIRMTSILMNSLGLVSLRWLCRLCGETSYLRKEKVGKLTDTSGPYLIA